MDWREMPYRVTACRPTLGLVDGNPVNHHAPDWPYVQMAVELRQAVAGMRPDEPLPSIARLCHEYGVSPKTASKATASHRPN